MSQAEDIYQKLSKTQNTIMKKEKARQEDLDTLWSDAGSSQHNAKFGVPDYLNYLESYLQSKVFEHQNLDHLLRLGVSQSSQISSLPEVKLYENREEILDNIPQERYLLSLIGNHSFLDYKNSLSKPIALAIGPERGWVREEEEDLIAANFRPIKISKHTLRVEIATFSALAQLEMFR